MDLKNIFRLQQNKEIKQCADAEPDGHDNNISAKQLMDKGIKHCDGCHIKSANVSISNTFLQSKAFEPHRIEVCADFGKVLWYPVKQRPAGSIGLGC